MTLSPTVWFLWKDPQHRTGNISFILLTHWGRVTHICVGKLTIIGSDNGLSPGRRQAIIWTNAGILLIGHLGTNFSVKLIEIETFSLKKNTFENIVWKMAAILSRPQCVKCKKRVCCRCLLHKGAWAHSNHIPAHVVSTQTCPPNILASKYQWAQRVKTIEYYRGPSPPMVGCYWTAPRWLVTTRHWHSAKQPSPHRKKHTHTLRVWIRGKCL